MNYPVGDFLIQIKNAYMAHKKEVTFLSSNKILAVAKILEREGYIGKTKTADSEIKNVKKITIELLYKDRKPAINEVNLVSKPSVHHYINRGHLKKAAQRHGIGIMSTSKGVMTNRDAAKAGVGGELICQIY